MKNILKTLALLTVGVGAVAVVRRVRNQREYLKIIENVKKRNEERADGWKTSVTVIPKENPKDDLIIIH